MVDILAGLRVDRPAWELHLIVPRDGPVAHQARDLGVRVTTVPFGGRVEQLGDSMVGRGGVPRLMIRGFRAIPAALSSLLRYRRALRRIRPSVVHAHGFKMQLLAMWSAPRGVAVVIHLHDYVGARRVMSRLLSIHPRRPIQAVAISRSIREDALPVLGHGVPIAVIHNALDGSYWTPGGRAVDLDAASGLDPAPTGTVRVGLVATMARWKGHETFLRALALLPPDLPVRGYVIGGSIYRTKASQFGVEELKQLAGELGLSGRIGFTGFLEEPVEAMRALDVVVHASTRPEPFGRVIIEGMAVERCVIMRASGGAAELVEPGKTALACLTGAPTELAEAIHVVVGDESLRRALGIAGRQAVLRDFSRDRMTNALVEVYRAAGAITQGWTAGR